MWATCVYDAQIVCSLFKLNELAGTRGHHFKLWREKKPFLISTHIFRDRGINKWNSMPSDIVLAGTGIKLLQKNI